MDVSGIGVTVGRWPYDFHTHRCQQFAIYVFIFVGILAAAVFYLQAAHEFSLGGRVYSS